MAVSTSSLWGAPEVAHLVGREQEQDLLRGWLDQAWSGHGRLVLVSGEAGIGKTSLVAQLAVEAEAAGALALWGHAYDLSVTPPYGPWLEIGQSYQASQTDLPAPEFLDDPLKLAALGSQERIIAAMTAFFQTAAGRRPLVLILDDLHWADRASLDLLRSMARQSRDVGILAIATYRGDELRRQDPLAQLLPLLVRESGAERLELHRLPRTQFPKLLRDYALPRKDLARLIDYLDRRTEGNPFYFGEVVRALEESSNLFHSPTDPHWHLGDLTQLPVPPLLIQFIERRLGQIDDESRGLLAIASVIGPEVQFDLWSAVSGATEDQLLIAIEAGLDARVLIESPTPAGTVTQFRHALVREALIQGMTHPRRRIWHRRVAEELARRPRLEPERIASHFSEAGDQRAIGWLNRAATSAARSYSWWMAVDRLNDLLALQERFGVEEYPPALILFEISHLLRFADPPEALNYGKRALLAAEQSGDRGIVAVSLAQRGYLRFSAGEMRAGLDDLERAAATFDLLQREDPRTFDRPGLVFDNDSDSLARIVADRLAVQIILLGLVGRLSDALRIGESMKDAVLERIESDRPANELGEDDGVAGTVALGLGLTYAHLGRIAEAHQYLFQSSRLYQLQQSKTKQSVPLSIVPLFVELSALHLPYEIDKPEELRKLTQRMQAAKHQGGEFAPSSGSGDNETPPPYLLWIRGDWQTLRAASDKLDNPTITAEFSQVGRAAIGEMALAQGDRELLEHCIAAMLPDGPNTEPGDVTYAPALALQRLAARQALRDGDFALARAWMAAYDRWIVWAGSVRGRADGVLTWAEYHLASGDLGAARERAGEALRLASDPRQPLTLIAVLRLLGRLDLKERRFDRAEDYCNQAIQLAGDCRALFEQALGKLLLAELHLAQGSTAAVEPLLDEVEAVCAPRNATPALERAAALREAFQGRPAEPEPTPDPAGLTAREVEVLQLVAQGMTNQEVAERLFVSPRTVGVHLNSIYRKINVSSRTAAAHFAIEHGLI